MAVAPPMYRLQRSGFISRVTFGTVVPPMTQTATSASTVAESRSIVFLDTTTGGFPLTFPPTSRGDSIVIKHVGGTLPAELVPNAIGEGIGSAGSSMTIYPGQGLVFAADTVNHIWQQIGTV